MTTLAIPCSFLSQEAQHGTGSEARPIKTRSLIYLATLNSDKQQQQLLTATYRPVMAANNTLHQMTKWLAS